MARGLSALQKVTLDFAYKRRLERLERPPSRFGLPEFDFIPAHIVNCYYGFPGTYPYSSDGIVICGNSFRTKDHSFRIDDEWIDGEEARVLCNKYRVTVHKSIKRLEQRGLISKLPLSTDTNRFGYVLTEKGVELMANNTK